MPYRYRQEFAGHPFGQSISEKLTKDLFILKILEHEHEYLTPSFWDGAG